MLPILFTGDGSYYLGRRLFRWSCHTMRYLLEWRTALSRPIGIILVLRLVYHHRNFLHKRLFVIPVLFFVSSMQIFGLSKRTGVCVFPVSALFSPEQHGMSMRKLNNALLRHIPDGFSFYWLTDTAPAFIEGWARMQATWRWGGRCFTFLEILSTRRWERTRWVLN